MIIGILISSCASRKNKITTTESIINDPLLEILNDTITKIPDPEISDPIVAEPKVVVLASIQKSPCFGRCPVFEARIYSDGKAVYNGVRFVEKEGIHYAYLNESQINEIIAKALDFNFLELAPIYPENGERILDFPNTITYFQYKNKELKIINNHDAPQNLLQFEQYLLDLLENLDWLKQD